jgi:ubiquinone/menaquinone biosynthesis C-methylase UbiE
VVYPDWLVDCLRDPKSTRALRRAGKAWLSLDGEAYTEAQGILSLVHPRDLEGSNKEMQRLYRWLAPFYEWSERFMARALLGMDMDQGRAEIVAKLGLGRGVGLLEVSPGPGVFHPWLRQSLGEAGHLVSLDLSLPMLLQARARHAAEGAWLLQGNGEYLPFADASFDALFHFGGINLFSDPDRALREFVRVVKPGGIVAYGDEGFAPGYPDTWRRRMLTRMNPGYLRPRPGQPAGLVNLKEDAVYGGLGYLVVANKG